MEKGTVISSDGFIRRKSIFWGFVYGFLLRLTKWIFSRRNAWGNKQTYVIIEMIRVCIWNIQNYSNLLRNKYVLCIKIMYAQRIGNWCFRDVLCFADFFSSVRVRVCFRFFRIVSRPSRCAIRRLSLLFCTTQKEIRCNSMILTSHKIKFLENGNRNYYQVFRTSFFVQLF